MINRCAISVRVRQPFLDWLRSLPDPVQADMTLQDANEDSRVYLLPEYEFDDEQTELLKEFYDLIFEVELGAWWIDAPNWPQERTFQMFREWFDVEFHSMVEDIVDPPLR
jgi:hypothetical protein